MKDSSHLIRKGSLNACSAGMQTSPELPVSGAEKLTLIERFIVLLHLPYTLGCLALALVIGFPGQILSSLPETLDFNRALERILNTYSQGPVWTAFLDLALNTAIVFYMLLMIRYMREKLVSAESKLIGLISEGELGLHRIFGQVSNQRAQIASSVLLLFVIQVFLQTYGGLSTSSSASNPFTIIISLVIGVLFYLTAGTFVWVYASSLWGLHRFGREPLRLKSYYEDRLLGAGAVGSLSLSLAISYYTVFGPVAFESIVLSPDLVGYATLFPLVMLGGVMFFLPLYSIHVRMLEERRRQEESLRLKLAELVSASDNPRGRKSEPVYARIDRLIQLEILHQSEKRLQDVPTWPYDKRTLEYFTAIFLSVTGAVLSRLVLGALNL